MSLSQDQLNSLSVTAGFDVTPLDANGYLDLSDPFLSGEQIALAVSQNGVPTANGIALIEAVAQDDGVSNTVLIETLVGYQHGSTDPTAAQAVGTAILNLIQGGGISLTAAAAVADLTTAALGVATDYNDYGFASNGAVLMGQQLGVMLGQLAGSFGADPIAAAVAQLEATPVQSVQQALYLLSGLSTAGAASVSATLEAAIGNGAASLSTADITLANPQTAAQDIATAVLANGTQGAIWQGLALIESLSVSANVSPVSALIYYEHELASLPNANLDGSDLAQLVGGVLGGLTAIGTLDNTSTASDAVSVVLAIAASGTTTNASSIGADLVAILSPLVTISAGEGDNGGQVTFNPFTSALSSINSAITNGALTAAQGLGLLSGIAVNTNEVSYRIESSLQTSVTDQVESLIGGGANQVSASSALTIMAGADAVALAYSVLGTTFPSFSQVVTTIQNAITSSQLTGTQALTFLDGIASSYGIASDATVGDSTVTVLDALAAANASLINNSSVSAATAFNLLNQAAIAYGYTFNLPTAVFEIVGTQGTSLATKVAAASVLDDSSVTQGVSAGHLAVADAITLLSVIAYQQGDAQTPEDALYHIITDNGVAGTDGVAGIVAAMTANGATPDQIITKLANVASDSVQGPFIGGVSNPVGNPGLMTAAAQQIYTIATANAITAAQLAQDFAGAAAQASGFGVAVLGDIGAVSDSNNPSGPLSLAAGTIAALITPATATAAQPLYPEVAAADIGGANLAVLIAVEGQLDPATAQGAGYALQAGRFVQTNTLANPGQLSVSTYANAIIAAYGGGELTAAQTALMLAPVAPTSSELATLATAPNVDLVATFTAAIATGQYDANVTIEALGFIGGQVPSLQAAVQSEIQSLIAGNVTSASGAVTVLAQLAAASSASASAAAGDIAYLLTRPSPTPDLTPAAAMTAIGNAIAANSGFTAGGLGLIEAVAADADTAYNASGVGGVETAAQSEISQLIGAGTVTASAAATVLQTLQGSATGPLLQVVDDELAILDETFAALDGTVGTGTPAQIQIQATALAALLSSNPTQATQVLADMSGRITGGTLTATGATEFLLALAAFPAAQQQAIATLVGLVTPAMNQTTGVIPTYTAINQIVAELAPGNSTGSVTSALALTVLEQLASIDSGDVQGAIAGGIVTGGFSISQIADAVTGGGLQPTDAFTALGDVVSSSLVSPATQAAAISEIETLAATYPDAAPAALPGLMALVESTTAATRATGYAAIESVADVSAAFAGQALTSVLGLLTSPTYSTFPGIVADAETGFVALVQVGAVPFSTVTADIATLPGAQQLSVYVALLGQTSTEPGAFGQMQAIFNQGNPPFTADDAVTAIVSAYGTDTARTATTDSELETLLYIVGAQQFVTDLAQVPSSTQLTVLGNLLQAYNAAAASGNASDAAIANTLSARISAILSGQAPAQLAASLATLYTNGTFTGAQVLATGVNDFLAPNATENFLAFVAALAGNPVFTPQTITQGIVDAVTASDLSAAQGIDALVAIGAGAAPALQNAAATALGTALVNGTAIATGAMANVTFAIEAGMASAAQAVTFLTETIVAQPSVTTTIVGEIDTLVVTQGAIGGLAAVTAMALAANAPASSVQIAVATAISQFVATISFTPAQEIAAITAAIGTSPSALTPDAAILVLAGFAGQGNAGLQNQVGEAIAGLVTTGTTTVSAVDTDLYYTAYLALAAITAAQLTNVAVGLAAGGSAAGAAAIFNEFLYHNTASASSIGQTLDAAVTAGLLTALQVVDLSANIFTTHLVAADSVSLILPLITSGAIGAAAAVQELGTFIGTSPNFTASDFMTIVAALAAADPAAATAIGTGVAASVIAGSLTFAQVETGVQLAVNGNATLSVTPVLSSAEAANLLIGLGASTLGVQAGAALAWLTGFVGTRAADPTPSGNQVILVGTGVSGIDNGDFVTDLTNLGAIPVGTQVTALNGSAVVLSANLASAIGTNDTLVFYNAGDAGLAATIATAIESAVTTGPLSGAQALNLMAGAVAAGSPGVGAAAAPLYQAGYIAISDFNSLLQEALAGNVPQSGAAYLLAAAWPAALAIDAVNHNANAETAFSVATKQPHRPRGAQRAGYPRSAHEHHIRRTASGGRRSSAGPIFFGRSAVHFRLWSTGHRSGLLRSASWAQPGLLGAGRAFCGSGSGCIAFRSGVRGELFVGPERRAMDVVERRGRRVADRRRHRHPDLLARPSVHRQCRVYQGAQCCQGRSDGSPKLPADRSRRDRRGADGSDHPRCSALGRYRHRERRAKRHRRNRPLLAPGRACGVAGQHIVTTRIVGRGAGRDRRADCVGQHQ